MLGLFCHMIVIQSSLSLLPYRNRHNMRLFQKTSTTYGKRDLPYAQKRPTDIQTYHEVVPEDVHDLHIWQLRFFFCSGVSGMP